MLSTDEKYRLVYRKYDDNRHEGKPVCPLCGKTYKEGTYCQSLESHIKKHHIEIYDEYIALIENFKNQRLNSYVTCPICGKNYKDLTRHVKECHNYSDVEQFKRDFPETPISVKKVLKNNKTYICEHCGSIFNRKNEYSKHLLHTHNIDIRKVEDRTDKKFICAICGFKTNSLKDHVCRKHNITWERYCEKYNHDITKKAYHDEAWNKSIKIRCPEIGLNKFTRSLEEFKVYYTSYINDFHIEYEPESIKVDTDIQVYYLPDFKLNSNVYIEIKTDLKRYDFDKYDKIKKAMEKQNKKLLIMNYSTFCKQFNLKSVSHRQICLFLKQMLENDNAEIIYSQYKGIKSNLLNDITPDYINNKNIKYSRNFMEDIV